MCHSVDPYNLYLENITMDYYSLMGGFTNWIQWNYPEAFLFDHHIIKNFTAYQSQDRVVPINAQMLNYQGAGNFTLQKAAWGIYGTR